MLEHVVAHQTRFVAPGLSPDARGVALGRTCAVLLPALDRVVGLFRALSQRGALDDVLASLSILQLSSPLKSREFLVQIPVNSSHVADGIAAAANLVGGLTFTGTAKHFVKYRDSRSPLGYDVDNLYAGQGDFMLYASEFVQAYNRERELPFAQLVQTLSLERDRREQLRADDIALLRLVPGLWRAVTSYLHRNNVSCEVAACETVAKPGTAAERCYLLRGMLPPRVVTLFSTTPGIEVYQLKGKHVAVQVGYRHPFELSSCSTMFAPERFYLFSGARNCLELIAGEVTFVSARALVQLQDPERAPRQQEVRSTAAAPFAVPLRLAPAVGVRAAVRASRIALAQAAWLKKLVYLLPPPLLERYTLCATADSFFLYSEAAVEFIPLGTLFYPAAPGVLVPLGYEIVPRVRPEVLVEHLGTEGDKLVFFVSESEAPLALSRSAFVPLQREILMQVTLHAQANALEPVAEAPVPRLVNDPLGVFPLWGFAPRSPSEEG